ncbi:hypothetical protein MLN18_02485 [Escherichia coli]|nr:hypothetical protein [Escherichia coli]MCN5265318.1 hypothetical protein [Escherichia coli]
MKASSGAFLLSV